MIVTKDVLYVHVPKMAGTSVRRWLLDNLPPPILHVKEHGHGIPAEPGVVNLRGSKHGDLVAARPLVQLFTGRDIAEMPLVLACIRNPYEREVSWFWYWQGRAEEAQRVYGRLWCTFEQFTERRSTLDRNLRNYYELDGVALPGLVLPRVERLGPDLVAALRGSGLAPQGEVPRLNTGRHEGWQRMYSRRSEAAVFERYRWYFERGLYERFESLVLDGAPELDAARLSGPVALRGKMHGLFDDGWVGADLTLEAAVMRPVRSITLEGWFHPGFPPRIPLIATIGRERFFTSVSGNESLEWRLPCAAEPGEIVSLGIQVGQVVRPCDAGVGPDRRPLSFQLRRLVFA